MFFEHDYRTKQLELAKERFRHRCEQDISVRDRADRRCKARVRQEAERKTRNEQKMAQVAEKKRKLRQEEFENAQLRYWRNVAEQQAAERRADSSLLARLQWTAKTECPMPEATDIRRAGR
jgi:hypothetical protein